MPLLVCVSLRACVAFERGADCCRMSTEQRAAPAASHSLLAAQQARALHGRWVKNVAVKLAAKAEPVLFLPVIGVRTPQELDMPHMNQTVRLLTSSLQVESGGRKLCSRCQQPRASQSRQQQLFHNAWA